MTSYVKWSDIRAELVERAGGEDAVEAGTHEALSQVVGHRLAEVPPARGLTKQQIADRMDVTKDRVSHIEHGKIIEEDA